MKPQNKLETCQRFVSNILTPAQSMLCLLQKTISVTNDSILLYYFWKAKDLKHGCSFFRDFASWDSKLIRTFALP